jgi:lactate dehydrogenase-like 2-hydroxyacid dehydrogenase
MNIIVTDGDTLNPGDNPWQAIETLGDTTVCDRTAEADVADRCQPAGILVVNKTPIREHTLKELSRLKFIAVSATGYDCVDVAAAGRRGIPVSIRTGSRRRQRSSRRDRREFPDGDAPRLHPTGFRRLRFLRWCWCF